MVLVPALDTVFLIGGVHCLVCLVHHLVSCRKEVVKPGTMEIETEMETEMQTEMEMEMQTHSQCRSCSE